MTAADLETLRQKVRPLLDLDAPADALPAYYTLHYDPARTHLYVHEADSGKADGFIAVCQTGQRLFQPTVVLRTADARAAVDLLHQALTPGRPYYLVTTPDLQEDVREVVEFEQSATNRVYRLDLVRFKPIINVLVVAEQGSSDRPRFVIRSKGEIASEAGVNWHSPHFAEIFVRTVPAARGRGWGRAVLSACTRWVLRSGRQPLYVVGEANHRSIALADAVGYEDTGVREFVADVICRA
jgi:RimJ/RimL family protein N-acetyltransferase